MSTACKERRVYNDIYFFLTFAQKIYFGYWYGDLNEAVYMVEGNVKSFNFKTINPTTMEGIIVLHCVYGIPKEPSFDVVISWNLKSIIYTLVSFLEKCYNISVIKY